MGKQIKKPIHKKKKSGKRGGYRYGYN